jgi:hypothetical protein
MESANHTVDSMDIADSLDNADSLPSENRTLDSRGKPEGNIDIGLSLDAFKMEDAKDESKMEVSVTPPPSVQRDGKESKATNTLTGTPSLVPMMKRINVSSARNNSSANSLASSSLLPYSPNKLSLRVTSFSENHWQDDASSGPIKWARPRQRRRRCRLPHSSRIKRCVKLRNRIPPIPDLGPTPDC